MPNLIYRHLFLLICLSLNACSSLKQNSHINAQQLEPHQAHYKTLSHLSWPELHTKHALLENQRSAIIPSVRNRLIALKDLNRYNVSQPNYYDNTLKNGVKRFQLRHGLNPDGVIGKTTLKELNISPNKRLQQLNHALSSWQTLPNAKENKEYIHVNLASYELSIYQGSHKNLNMNVVVGSPSWPTPTLSSEIKSIVVNPKWNVPKNITEKELIHKIADNADYLQEENISIMDGWHKGAKKIDPASIDWGSYTGDADLPYRLVQGAGDLNALGKIKFTFPNKEHIYLHDTPNKAAFSLTKRNLSHGCIRLERPIALLNYLFEHERLTRQETITEQLALGENTRHFALKKALPIFISRINAWVDEQGLLNFRD